MSRFGYALTFGYDPREIWQHSPKGGDLDMPFPQSFLDELMARSDIVDVVGSYVQLTRKGANLFGLCPFHSEKTGSFSVSPDKQIYYCFGCKRGGGVINFIMEDFFFAIISPLLYFKFFSS